MRVENFSYRAESIIDFAYVRVAIPLFCFFYLSYKIFQSERYFSHVLTTGSLFFSFCLALHCHCLPHSSHILHFYCWTIKYELSFSSKYKSWRNISIYPAIYLTLCTSSYFLLRIMEMAIYQATKSKNKLVSRSKGQLARVVKNSTRTYWRPIIRDWVTVEITLRYFVWSLIMHAIAPYWLLSME